MKVHLKPSGEYILALGALSRLEGALVARGVKRLFLVADAGVTAAGITQKVIEAAGSVDVLCFDRVMANPTDAISAEAAGVARAFAADAILGVGGGSPIDAAKAIAVLVNNDVPLANYCAAGADPWEHAPLPVFAIPTTAGTGAEVSAAAMVNLPDQGVKSDIFGRSILPRLVIADPELTFGLPRALTAYTGIDALSHALEAYVATGANPHSDALAEKSIALVAGHLPVVLQEPTHPEGRSAMLLASSLAVMAASSAAGLGVIHSLAQTLGGYYNLPHGLTIAHSFAAGMHYNVDVCQDKFANFARLMGVDTQRMTPSEAAQAGINAYNNFCRSNAIDTALGVTVPASDFDALASRAMRDGCTPTNPRPLRQDDFVALFASLAETPVA